MWLYFTATAASVIHLAGHWPPSLLGYINTYSSVLCLAFLAIIIYYFPLDTHFGRRSALTAHIDKYMFRLYKEGLEKVNNSCLDGQSAIQLLAPYDTLLNSDKLYRYRFRLILAGPDRSRVQLVLAGSPCYSLVGNPSRVPMSHIISSDFD